MELLSPAGGREALEAAVQNGADAVYLGYTAFGARSYAGNFDENQLRAALDYAHERGKKIYVTVNTLIKQDEFEAAAALLEHLNAWGADAVIVQDIGLAREARARFPQLPLHASTQMTVHNAQGAQILKDAGFTRVVPARECSFDELTRMAATGVEIEAFVHGALCVSVSGQCLFSSFAGGRSGNRGRCAQPCRLPYAMADGTRGYLLSTRDLMLLDRLGEMRDAGVYSLKIEGRMKRPEYVAIVTRAYREALDCAQNHLEYHPDAQTLDALRQIFNRGGFTEGYAMGQSNAALLSWEKPNHWGVPLGTVEKVSGALARVRVERELTDGDGLQFQGRQETDVTYAGHDTPAGQTALVRVGDPSAVRAGDAVVRLTSEKQMRAARESMTGEHVRIPVHMHLTAVVGAHPVLEITDGVHTARVSGAETVAQAQSRALDEQSARRQLEKTGGTPYVLDRLTVEGENAFLSASALNALRRDALEALAAERKKMTPRRSENAPGMPHMPVQEKSALYAQTGDLSQAGELLTAGADAVYWRPDDYRTEKLAVAWDALDKAVREKIVFVLPQMTYTAELERLSAWVRAAKVPCVALSNISQLQADFGSALRVADAPMNVYNARSAALLFERGAARVTLSMELNAQEMERVITQGGNYELIAYGRAQLMLLSHCTERVKHGETVQDGACARCVGTRIDRQLIDRRGFSFLQARERMEHGCFVRLYNALPTDMARRFDRVRALGVSVRVIFTDEVAQERFEIVRAYRAMMNGQADPRPASPAQSTLGHLLRGVE